MDGIAQTLDITRKQLRALIEERLSPDVCSQEYVDILVEKYLMEIEYEMYCNRFFTQAYNYRERGVRNDSQRQKAH